MSTGGTIQLRLLTRRDCELCDEMKAVVGEFVVAGEASLEEVDVDDDPQLAARHGEEVPVLFVNGRRAFKYRVGRAELRRRLAGERRRAVARRLRRLASAARRRAFGAPREE